MEEKQEEQCGSKILQWRQEAKALANVDSLAEKHMPRIFGELERKRKPGDMAVSVKYRDISDFDVYSEWVAGDRYLEQDLRVMDRCITQWVQRYPEYNGLKWRLILHVGFFYTWIEIRFVWYSRPLVTPVHKA